MMPPTGTPSSPPGRTAPGAGRGPGTSTAPVGPWRPASALAAGLDVAAARRFLALLRDPAVGCVELRVLRAVIDRNGLVRRPGEADRGFAGSTLAGWYEDTEPLLAQARRVRDVSAYVTINPVRPDLLARSDHRLARARHTTRDEDVLVLRWLYLDIDPVRPPDIPSTDEEHRAAIGRRDEVLRDHPELAASALWGSSGNGASILARLPDYPNDARHRALVAAAVRSLAVEHDDDRVVIDRATSNPSRLIGLPGSLKAKGSDRPDRPWRRVTLDGFGGLGPAPEGPDRAGPTP